MHTMTTRRPYLIRAFNEWIIDNGLTPYLSVDADYPEVEVPRQYVVEGEVILNISPSSVRNLELGQDYIMFDARFSGKSYQIVVPVKAVLAIFAKENGEGMAFVYAESDTDEAEHTQEMLIQSDIGDDEPIGVDLTEEDPQDPPPRPPTGRPSLKIVK